MPIAPGTRLGPYEIVSPLGAGGMGEVYRARDTRLGRDVAVKVLPGHLNENSEIRARFEREARTISSLNHPHICTLHDVGRENGTDYLVMELVDGETLAARLAKGPLASEEALRIGTQIADALDKAHRAGIVHRDLKPGNIMLTKAGAKLMDFGLARATGLAGPASASGVSITALTQSPTIAAPLTAEGSLVGTFQYMSPEQLEGKEADARSDLWSLGCVLYEMATGRRAFEGRSQASLIGSIMNAAPTPMSSIAPLAPPSLERLVQACLTKDPEERIQTAHDVKLQLAWIAQGGSQAGVPAPVAARRRGRERTAWMVAGVGVLAALALAGVMWTKRPAPAHAVRFDVMPPPGIATMTWPRISPDGLTVAFLGTDSTGQSKIWVRPLNSLEAFPLAGTEGAARPFWSADSKNLAFFAGNKLKRIPSAGGPAQLVCEASGYDGSWGKGGVILFDNTNTDSIQSVPAAGGVPTPATFIDRANGEIGHAWPQFLPDGKHFLFLAYNKGDSRTASARVGTLGSRAVRKIGALESRVEYTAGRLVYVRAGVLVAQPFDAKSMKLAGDQIPLAERVALQRGRENFSVSQTGAIAYQAGALDGKSELVWFDRGGQRLGVLGEPAAYTDLALSPDGKRVAVAIRDASNREDIWVRDLERGTMSRLTFEASDELWPAWSPDGTRISYTADVHGTYQTYVRLASGVGDAQEMPSSIDGNDGAIDWSADGRLMTMQSIGTGSWDILVQSVDGKEKPTPFLHTKFNEYAARFSPDGRWIAYSSNESGRVEVYVTSYPTPSGKWQVSTSGGVAPSWRGDGRELFYRTLDGTTMAVPVIPGSEFRAGTPVALFKVVVEQRGTVLRRMQPTRDGQRFLANVPTRGQDVTPFTVVVNWPAELAKK